MTALLRLPELEKYELLEEIGHGGMATVFRARDRRLGREVAVKLIHRHLRDKPEVAERFAREARAVAKLRHDNIVEVFDVSDVEESERYLVVELVRGQTLRQRIEAGGAMAPEVAAAVALEVGAGLEHAHRQGVIHRDVKPENVLLELHSPTNDGEGPTPVRVKLTDFGIAKLLDAQGVTSTGEVLGSPAHMAPEQIEGGAVGPRTDVFALGVLLYECMVGSLPFSGEHPAQVLRKVLEGDFVPPERRDARIGASYSRLVERALARDPEQRFASVSELLDALRAELGALGYGKVPPLLEQLVRPDPQFQDDVSQRLVERGTRARADGQFRVAADCFGRALAYRPGDRALLRKVSGLARRRRVQRLMRDALLACLVVAVAVVAWRELDGDASSPQVAAESPPAPLEWSRRGPTSGRGAPGDPSALDGPPPGSPEGASASGPDPESPPVVARSASETTRAAPVARPRARPPASRPRRSLPRQRAEEAPPGQDEAESPGPLRDVVVRITGATGGTLQIDGKPLPWYGNVRHSLPLGPHRFSFVAPDATCCESTERTVVIAEGEGVQTVVGDIPFRDATLRISSADGRKGYLTCPTLFSGNQRFPGQRIVAMSRARTSDECVIKEDDPGAVPRKRNVTLLAGQTTPIQWP